MVKLNKTGKDSRITKGCQYTQEESQLLLVRSAPHIRGSIQTES